MSRQFHLLEFLPYLLNQAAEEASASFARVYKARYGLRRTDWRVLFHLGIFGDLTARDIAERTREDKTRISRAVARLEKSAMVSRKPDPEDRRAERLSLTSVGQQVYDDLAQEAARHDAALERNLGVRNSDVLRKALIQLADLPAK